MIDHPRSTLVKPPAIDPAKSTIENTLELLELKAFGPDIYTNTRPLWHPPGARGIFGGAVIAQSLTAAQKTVPLDFLVHSMHCYFVLAGSSEGPIIYYVEHVREGRSFATRTVQARQRGKCIFTTTLSFMRENSAGRQTVQHAVKMPKDVRQPSGNEEVGEFRNLGPFMGKIANVVKDEKPSPQKVKIQVWHKTKDKISPRGGHEAHLAALAYVSDSGFIGTISRVHDLGDSRGETSGQGGNPKLSMMVSLDHTIYFHAPRKTRADEWMFSERTSPWSRDERGVVVQHIFSSDGTLLATCFQEGVVRLKQDTEPMAKL